MNEMLVFEERGKPEYPEKSLSVQGKKTNKLNPHMTLNESNPGHIGGRLVLSPLYHPGPHSLNTHLKKDSSADVSSVSPSSEQR